MIREAVDKANSGFRIEELWEALREVADERGEINRRRLGKWIARHQGRIVDGLRFERASGTTSAERWQAKAVVVTATASASAATSISSVTLVSSGDGAASVSEICELELRAQRRWRSDDLSFQSRFDSRKFAPLTARTKCSQGQ